MKCKHETKVLDGKKSYCERFGCWTNCREVDHCTYESMKKKPEQLTLF